ncbi:hypothetical protein NJC40_10005 [Pseudomonas sp. 21LCFQ02]|uniref:hypothetical protein n=1 Tax=unclassified Pseudomonas TaxID=196821 RepID=UPI002096A596|nr:MULTISPECIES: hypothetical protein [unclassified Pseudomonas]MCO8161453.1 hypothetical protein [Pseudomonas sp. 21LCFQ010]MCO8168108.1 hypothetical protein [Pseudomonas sp. 21LCFQ02]
MKNAQARKCNAGLLKMAGCGGFSASKDFFTYFCLKSPQNLTKRKVRGGYLLGSVLVLRRPAHFSASGMQFVCVLANQFQVSVSTFLD